MKKVISVLFVALLVVCFAATVSAERHYDREEALEVGSGTWYSSTGKTYKLVYSYANGSENTLINKGYTDPEGTSEIHFDYKGVEGCIIATYYAEENTYYAVLYANTDGTTWKKLNSTLYKVRD